MKHYFSIIITIIFTLGSVLLFSQNDNPPKDPSGWKKADKLYHQKGYMASAAKYQMKQSEGEMTPVVMSRIANSYRLNGDSELAEYWFAKCINKISNVEDYLHYAEVLQTNGKCEDAIRWFEMYTNQTATDREFIADCEELNSFKQHENIEVENLKALNTPFLDYSAIIHDGGVVFTSTREIQSVKRVTDTWTKSNFSDVFFAKIKEDGGYEDPVSIGDAINKKYHDGVTSITSSGTIMYFSRNNSKKKGKNKVVNLKIYQSIFVDGAWKDAVALSINGDDFVSCHPAVSANGKLLYFASNRPGGFGGMDIYVSENIDGEWQTPENLGPTVNSSGNELFPFINQEGVLFFASNGHKGLGGLDIFYVEKNNTSEGPTWNVRKNMGTPMNTSKDDFGFFSNGDLTQGYLTSNRPGGKGGDDIYTWVSIDGKGLDLNNSMEVELQFADLETNEGLRNAIVTIEDIYEKTQPTSATTSVEGYLNTSVDPNKIYKVTVEKNGFVPMEKEVSGKELMSGKIDVKMEKVKCLEASGIVVNEKYNNAISNTTVTLINKCTGEKTVVTSDKEGNFDFCLDVGCDFDIIATKENFIETETMVSTMDDISNWENKAIKIEMLPVTRPVKSDPVSKDETKDEITKHFLGDDKATFKVGQVFTLKNIYYDFNKSDIRPDAQVELDYVVVMMKQFPAMKITLSSHTDARGKNSYNKKLSEKRAESARKYILSKGITPDRILSTGYGESVLKNNCKDGINCPDDQHQINRRTEIMINKMD